MQEGVAQAMAEQKFLPVGRHDIRVGEPLPYSIYDRGGMLLLRRGFVINLPRQLEVLLNNGVYHAEGEARPQRGAPPPPLPVQSEEQSTFEMLDLVKLRLKRLFDNVRLGREIDQFVGRVEDIALTIQEACTHDTDSALANLHLDYESSYAVVHHLQAGIVCELIGKRLGVKEESRLPLICAGITHDWGLLDIQDELDRQSAPLSPAQRERINAHPRDSGEQLRALGVSHPQWLDAVRHHHERLDGSGYPDALRGDAIGVPTRVLAVADMYSAMVRDRPYRKALVSKEAMRSLMIEQGTKADSRLIQLMIRELGVFPPGAIVKLANGEVAVVTKRQQNSLAPTVAAFIRPDGMPMLSPVRRDTGHNGHAVDGMVPFSQYKGSIAIIRGIWNHD